MKFLLITIFTAIALVPCKAQDSKNGGITDSDFRNAVRNGKVDLVKQHLEKGYDVNRLGIGGTNALQEGVLHHEVAKLLIEKGIKINQQHKYDGSTPLIVACMASNIKSETVKLLLDNGADPKIKDKQGKSALDYATENAKQFPNPKYGFAVKAKLLKAALNK